MSRSEWNRNEASLSARASAVPRYTMRRRPVSALSTTENTKPSSASKPRGVEEAQQAAGIAGVTDVLGLRQPERSVFVANEEYRLVVLQDGHDLRRVAGPRDRLALEARRDVRSSTVAKGRPHCVVVADDPPNHDHVIAGVDEVVAAAVEPRGRTLEDGVARRPGVPLDAGEAIVGRSGECAGDRLLALGEDVHGVPVALGEHLEAPPPLVDAHEHERRVERDRGERIGGEPRGLPCRSSVVTTVTPVRKAPSACR